MENSTFLFCFCLKASMLLIYSLLNGITSIIDNDRTLGMSIVMKTNVAWLALAEDLVYTPDWSREPNHQVGGRFYLHHVPHKKTKWGPPGK